MKKRIFSKKFLITAVALLLLAAAGATALAAGAIPARVETKSGETLLKNGKATIDASNLDQGYLSVKYTGKKKVKIKVQIKKTDGTTYTYNLNNEGKEETFPLTEGDGSYSVKVFENTTGTKYAQAFAGTVKVKLKSKFAPFLYPNQYVNFNDDSQVVATAKEIIEKAGDKTALEKVNTIYDYVVKNISYDYDLAKTVKTGYLPEVDKVLEKGKGICFDYSAVMAAMLRSQDIPCKLVIGYAGDVYHAWIDVYIDGKGWVDQLIYFNGEDWSLMDPTFISSSNNGSNIREYVKDPSNYSQKYAY